MYIIRDIFRCKPGKAKELVEKFRRTIPVMERDDQFTNIRVMVDAVADYWTVVLEADCESLEHFERHMREFGARAEVQEAMAGYMDLVEGGRREIWRVV
jgi:hypothetical protein